MIELSKEHADQLRQLIANRDNKQKQAQIIIAGQQAEIECAGSRVAAFCERLGRLYSFDPDDVELKEESGIVKVISKVSEVKEQ